MSSSPMVVPGQQQGAPSRAVAAAAAATAVATTGNNSSPDFRKNNHYDPNHPRSSKRRCSYNHLGTTTTTENDNDCFDDVMAANTPPLRNEWFHESLTVIGSKHTTAASQQAQQQALILADLSSEVEALEHQLAQVKRRFEPAADRCAQAVCNSNSNSYTNTTTPSYEFEQARRACNPYEVLGETRPGGLNHGLFLNRSAIKLANIDAILDFNLVTSEHFYFADLCAAPGGFSEYLLRRYCHSLQQQQQQSNNNNNTDIDGCCRGFGMSLVGNNDQGHGTPWKLSQGPLLMGGHGNHDGVYYHICHGEDGTGDIFQWHNVQALQREIAAQQLAYKVRGKVALVTADGGVDAQRNCERQDAQTQKLVVCQVAAALSMLQVGGRFIIKLFGCQTTPILKAIMQELYSCFDTLQFLKPISSRPASAERYLVCTGFQGMSCSSSIMSDPQHHVFYGPKWINKILLVGQDLQIDPTVQAFLARVDRDMLKLNLKACFAILSKMESKTMRLLSNVNNNGNFNIMMTSGNIDNGDSMMKVEEDDNDNSSDEQWIQQGFQNYQHYRSSHRAGKLDVEHYRIGWRLF